MFLTYLWLLLLIKFGAKLNKWTRTNYEWQIYSNEKITLNANNVAHIHWVKLFINVYSHLIALFESGFMLLSFLKHDRIEIAFFVIHRFFDIYYPK